MIRKLIVASVVAGAATAAFVAPVDAKGRPTLVTRALEVNEATGEFSTLISLVTDLELADALSGKSQLTVFAPTDEAFENLFAFIAAEFPDATLTDEELTDIVLYHVTPGRRGADWLADRVGQEIPMANGDTALISASDAGLGLAVDGASVLIADVAASNGFIHAVDTVLLPPNVGDYLAD